MTHAAGREQAYAWPGTSFATRTEEATMDDDDDEMTPNQASDKEPAEGSRENVNLGPDAGNTMERGSEQVPGPERPPEGDRGAKK